MDETSVERHVEAMRNAEVIAVDTETTGFLVKDGRDYLMGISVAYRLGAFGIVSAYFPFRHQEGNLERGHLELIKSVIESKPLVFHNLKFDLHSLATIGIVPTGKLYDTLNIAQLINEELPSKSLDYLSKKFLNDSKAKDEVKTWADMYGWASVPANIMAPYAEHDAELTLMLFEKFWPQMREQELVGLWPTERQFTRLLTDMERRGVRIDPAFCEAKARKGRDRMNAILDDLDLDEDTLGPKALYRILIEELQLPVVKRTDKGAVCFDKDAMAQYDEMLEAMDSPIAHLVLEYRGWQKAVTSLYEPLLRLVSPDGRVRPNFKQHGTKTGRLSCAEPNLQQIPKRTEKPWNGDAKRAFCASEGFTLWGYDYSQLEFRLAAAYGQEQWLIEEFANPDGDVFTVMSERLGVSRSVVKTFTYGTLYGAGLAKTAQTLGQPEAAIEADYNSFRDSISGIRHVSSVATKKAKQRGYVKYWTGRRRHFPYADGHHKAFNSLLQGGGAELVKRAMIRLDSEVCDDNCRILLQVHDEIVFEIKDGMESTYDPLIVKIMTEFPEFGIPFKVEGKVWNA